MEHQGHTVALCNKLGAVCGSQGDCHRQLQQPEQAKACYEESVQHLRSCNSQHPEVRQLDPMVSTVHIALLLMRQCLLAQVVALSPHSYLAL